MYDEFSNERFSFLEERTGFALKKLKTDYFSSRSNPRLKTLTIVTMLAALRKLQAGYPDRTNANHVNRVPSSVETCTNRNT